MDYQNRFWGLLTKKLANEATAEELQDLHSLLLNHPELHHQAELLSDMWSQQPLPAKMQSDDAAYMRHIMKHKTEFFTEGSQQGTAETVADPEAAANEERSTFSSLVRKHSTLIGLVVVFVAAGLFFIKPGKQGVVAAVAEEISSVATKNGNRTKVVLPDGTQVWLNAGSTLDYNISIFNKELREVSLNGEAYFDVTKNEAKPFIIHTKKMDVKVVGTSFNVRSYNDEKIAEASLIRGSIEVTLKNRKDQKIILKPNEKISINTQDEQKEIKLKTGNTIPVKYNSTIPQIVVKELKPNPVNHLIPEIAWTQNRLYFDDKSLEEIAPMLEKWFGKNVIIQNEALSKIRYTGNFETETIETVLSYLKLSRSFNFKVDTGTVVIY